MESGKGEDKKGGRDRDEGPSKFQKRKEPASISASRGRPLIQGERSTQSTPSPPGSSTYSPPGSHSPDVLSSMDRRRLSPNDGRRGRRFGQARGIHRTPKEELAAEVQKLEESFRKLGKSGREIQLVTNYFRVALTAGWSLNEYSVNFEPEENDRFVRKALVRSQTRTIGPHVYNGNYLYCPVQLPGADSTGALAMVFNRNSASVTMRLQLKDSNPSNVSDSIYTQFYNLIVRKCLFGMGLEEMGRNFYDHEMAIDFPHLRIQLWPGYVTSMMDYEEDTLLCVEVTHKVIRKDNVLSVIQKMLEANRQAKNFEDIIENALVNCIVMTTYNRTTYKVTAVDFQASPASSFQNRKGEFVSYIDYYMQRYKLQVQSQDQPLLVVQPTKKDKFRRADTPQSPVLLLPEFCLFTGLTDAMRSNFTLMRELSKHLHMSPSDRVNAINVFMTRLQAAPNNLVEDLRRWGFNFETRLVECKGRTLGNENIIFGNGEVSNHKADWTMAFREKKLLKAEPLGKWIVIVTRRDSEGVDNLVRTMQKVSTPLGFDIRRPLDVMVLPDPKIQTFIRTIDSIFHSDKKDGLQMIFIVLPTNASEMYGAIKKRVVVDYGISSQCFLAKNLKSKGLMSIATKMVIQMCTKLGGEPWTVKIPLKDLMVVGYDTYGKMPSQIGAMVGSITPNFTRYYSTISTSTSPSDMCRNISNDLAKCIQNYKFENKKLPDRILMYQNAGADGDLDCIILSEVEFINKKIAELYMVEGQREPPRLTYIVLSKKTNTRIMAKKGTGFDNVPAGTILDNTVTVPNRYDFFLVSAVARQGTASPCYYTVIYDNSGLEADRLQLLTYKMCHLYFNWSGTVAVPAPIQLAHKLATLTAVAYEQPAHEKLSKLLYYL